MGSQIDQLQKAKIKLEKEKQGARAEVDEARVQTEGANKARVIIYYKIFNKTKR